MISKEAQDIFSRQKVNYIPPSPITHLTACNNFLAMSLKSSRLNLIQLQNPSEQCELDIPPSTSSNGAKNCVSHLHMDPTGEHLIVSMESGAGTFYLNRKDMKLKNLLKFKGHIVSSVGWNPSNNKPQSTGFILFGTNKGVIIETDTSSNATVAYSVELLSSPEGQPITGIKLHKMNNDVKNWLCLFTTSDRLYISLGNLASNYNEGYLSHILKISEASTNFFSLVGNGFNSTKTFTRPNSKLCVFPGMAEAVDLQYAWLQNSGVQYGQMKSGVVDVEKVVSLDTFFEFGRTTSLTVAVGICMTEYHIFVLFEDRLNVICKVNNSVVHEEIFNKQIGKPLGICCDPVSGFIWLFTDKSVFKYMPNDETKNLWLIYLDLGDHNMARKFAADNPQHMDVVLQRQCAKLMSDKKYVAAAEIYAMTSAPLEDVALKLLLTENRTALKTYLQRKLDKSQETERTQKSMLVFWLLELLLTELDEAKSGISSTYENVTSNNTSRIQGFDPHKAKELRDHLKMFLKNVDVIECLKNTPKAAVQLMASHGDVETLLYFSELIKDYDAVVNYYIQQERFEEALAVLQKQKNVELFHKFSTMLLPNGTKSLIDAWISMGANLKPKSLLTTIIGYCDDAKIVPEMCRYLEYHIDTLHCADQAVHNLLMSLYLKYLPNKLISYFEKEGKDPSYVRYDLKYALRTCLENNNDEATVFLYCVSEMYDEALEKALKTDSELCISVVKSPANSDVQRRLWLTYAHHIIEKDQDVRNCVALLKSSNGLIKIQDLLPFFPDFATIDNFKDCLCDCLAEHSGTIKSLQMEMKDASEVARQIKKQIDDVNNRYVIVKPRDKCSSCDQTLEETSFYSFLCHHSFHRKCLQSEMEDLLDNETRASMNCFEKRLKPKSTITRSNDSTSVHSGTSHIDDCGANFEELDRILSLECPFCGPLSVDAIDKPFFPAVDYANELKKWE